MDINIQRLFNLMFCIEHNLGLSLFLTLKICNTIEIFSRIINERKRNTKHVKLI